MGRGIWRLAALLAIALAALAACGPASSGGAAGGREAVTRAAATVTAAQLPPEAGQTLAEIQHGPPYRFERDGIVFHNREGRLPRKPDGYYREFTVPTPGSKDRGARRIVAGAGGERYYSGDHYRRFREIVP